jgi:putative selenate reductase molybdopterin-binding subunit
MPELTRVGVSLTKIDALSLATGSEKFCDDFRIPGILQTALLTSPHPHAEIRSLDTREAEAVEGVVDILSFRNVDAVLHTSAGQGFPEPSPYDALLFDRRLRYVGDRVALVVAESEEAARRGAAAIKVEYDLLEPLFDPEAAEDAQAPRLHAGEEHAKIPALYEPERNVAAAVEIRFGDPEAGFEAAAILEEHVYHTQYAAHCALEPHAALAFFDPRGRLVIISTTQVPFHARRIVSHVCGIPLSRIRVIKPRIGGGFGGKQEVILEPLAALAAWRCKRPVRMVMSRREVFVSSRTRHPMRIRLKTGTDREGRITALEMEGLMNTGAYGSHALTVLSNVGAKVLPLFNKIEHLRFYGKAVYTNLPVGGAYRGYGATQGYFAFNQQLDMISRRAGLDMPEYCKRWHIRENETSAVFQALGEGKEGVAQVLTSCRLDECIDRGAEAIGWHEKRGRRLSPGGDRVRGVGMAVCMQGSGIPLVDMGAAAMKMNEDGSFNLYVGATDIGTGSDTVLAQIAAEVLRVDLEKMIVLSSDTDLTPFDVGAYASSTTYVSGAAVAKCARRIADQILRAGAGLLGADPGDLEIADDRVIDRRTGQEASYARIAVYSLYQHDQFQIQAQASHVASISPPPFIAQFAEVELDRASGRLTVLKFVSAVDCGQPINPQLAEGQVEGAVLNGISYALCEEYLFNRQGRMRNPSFGDYKIYSTPDMPEILTILVDSYESSGPFGAKSVGEIAINGPAPAIANALYDAAGLRLYSLPLTPERVWRALKAEEGRAKT